MAGQAADVLVIFGITGDLAKTKTFEALYQMERRKVLQCPIVGVAAELAAHRGEDLVAELAQAA